MSLIKNPLIVALDVDTVDEAEALAGALAPYTGALKVGMQLFNSAGPEAVRRLIEKKASVFVDLKLHDIPNTVAGAARALTRLGAAIFNVHAAGGRAMMQEAANAARDEAGKSGIKPPQVIAVTVLTSIDEVIFSQELGFHGSIEDRVVAWARLAQEAGLDGVVASPKEISAIRKACGKDFVIITPGVRPAGAAANDQKRTMTPYEAVNLGASYLVVGRPVTAAQDPVEAARAILKEIGLPG
ncbi:MAG: Orotidine 5'-phosphate decarboxylase [Pelotomaculum sp. PtaB.Bin104]|nr:MAG: Orotidine 5'-phosphate decarboxylase [Pelotomaculum sp. PtaB.Bin104]